MIGHHEAADAVSRRQVRGLARERYLDASRTPRDKISQLPLSDSLEAFVDLKDETRGENDRRNCKHTDEVMVYTQTRKPRQRTAEATPPPLLTPTVVRHFDLSCTHTHTPV